MAQPGFTPILLFASGTTTNVPLAANLTSTATGAEVAINYADGKLFYKDGGGVVQVMASKATGTIGGTTGQVQYNNSGTLAGDADFTFDGTTVTMANDALIHGLNIGLGGGSIATNMSLGSNALGNNTTGTSNTTTGYVAGNRNTTGANNSFYGESAGYWNQTGSSNTGIGSNALGGTGVLTSFSYSTAVGHQALYYNAASNNTAVGYQAGYTNAIGEYNAYFGSGAGQAATGGYNTFIGMNAGNLATNGNGNTFIGQGAGRIMTTGSKNTILGSYNGNFGSLDIRTANNYIVLSDGDGNPRSYCDSNGVWSNGLGGSSQAWTDVSASRAFGTTYTNSTAAPIQIYVDAAASGQSYINTQINSTFSINGSMAPAVAAPVIFTSVIVPPGATYQVGNQGTVFSFNKWFELR